jgi:hypothetical protein
MAKISSRIMGAVMTQIDEPTIQPIKVKEKYER